MTPRFIIPVRSSDAWVSLSMVDGCRPFASHDRGCATDVTLTVVKPGCVAPPTRTCTGVDKCGNKTWRVTPAVTSSPVVITAEGTDPTGRVVFRLTPAFVALGKGRLNAELKACGKTIPIMFQVFSQPILVDYEVGVTTGCVRIGNLYAATIPDNCVVPTGWLPVNVAGVVKGYGRSESCGLYTASFVTEDGYVVYLDPATPCGVTTVEVPLTASGAAGACTTTAVCAPSTAVPGSFGIGNRTAGGDEVVFMPVIAVRSFTLNVTNAFVRYSMDAGLTYTTISAGNSRTWDAAAGGTLNVTNVRFTGTAASVYDVNYEV